MNDEEWRYRCADKFPISRLFDVHLGLGITMKITIWGNQIPDGTKINRRGYLSAWTGFESLLYVKSKFQRGAKGVKNIHREYLSPEIFVGIFNSRVIIVLIIGVSRPIRNRQGRGEKARWKMRNEWEKIKQVRSKVNFPDIFAVEKFWFRIQREPSRILGLVYPEISWLCVQNFYSSLSERNIFV